MEKIIISDLDGTLTRVDVLDFLTAHMSKETESIALREIYQQGKSHGLYSLKKRIDLLSDMSIATIEYILSNNINFLLREHYLEFADFIRNENISLILVSGNISPVVNFFKDIFYAKEALGTTINIAIDGSLSGMSRSEVGKDLFKIKKILSKKKISFNDVIYMGDDVSDLPFFDIFPQNISFNISSKSVANVVDGDLLHAMNIIRKYFKEQHM